MRCLPPAYSPVSGAHILSAALATLSDREVRRHARELLLREYDAQDVVLLGSATQALEFAIRVACNSLGRVPIALPAFSCYDVATAAIGAQAAVELYDLDPDTLSPDLGSLEKTLTAGARIVVVSPLYGFPVNWTRVQKLAERFGAIVIEDAAQAHGAAWRGAGVGRFGAMSILSFGRGKGWTGGHGGALLIRSESLAPPPDLDTARSAGAILTASMAWLLSHPAVYGLPRSIPGLQLGKTVYRDPEPPAAMSSFAAALIQRTRRASADEAEVRRRNAEAWSVLLRDLPTVRAVMPIEGSAVGYLRYPVRLGAGAQQMALQRDAVRLGIAPSYPQPLNQLAPLRPHLRKASEFAGARELAATLITLPTHSRVSGRDRTRVVAWLAAATERGARQNAPVVTSPPRVRAT